MVNYSTVENTQGLNEDASRFAYRAQVLQRKVLWMQVGQWVERLADWVQQTPIWKRIVTLWQRVQASKFWKVVERVGRWVYQIVERLRKLGGYLFSLFLGLLAGYGYRPGRALFWYFFVISSFTIAYSVVGHLPLVPDSLVFSVMSFHGRGFFPSLGGETSLHNPVVVWAAAEAVVGLFIEISFIATFTQRFFGK